MKSANLPPVEFIQANGEPYPVRGQFIYVNRQIGTQTGTIQMAAQFPNEGATLRPGGYGRVRVQTGMNKDALLIPQAAVIEVQSMYQVVVVTPDNKASFRPVKVGERVGPNWVISEGLKPGEKVIVEGFMKVREGVPVSPKPYSTRCGGGGRELTMSKFFINRPIVAIVIAILMVLVGVVSMLGLPTAQFPNIADPMIQVKATYPGADAQTIAESVATPIEQQMSGVSGMNYMYSLSASSGGGMTLYVDFQLGTDSNTDQILAQMRSGQANSQLPSQVTQQGVIVQPGTTAPFMLLDLYSATGSYDNVFLANYATINLQYALTRISGVGQVQIFGAGPYAMRIWVNPDRLASLGVTVPDITNAVQAQNKVNPAGQIGGEPVPNGQQFTYNVRAPGRLPTAEEFDQIIVRAQPDGSILRLKDVARVELGSQYYSYMARLGVAGTNKPAQPAALIAIYLTPGSNALDTRGKVLKMMQEARGRFPEGLDYIVALDTTLAVSAGIEEIKKTLIEALLLVILVVYIFLQGWRATLIPLLAVPVSLVGTFVVFPMLGFSINTLSLFGLVLAIGLVVDDAIVVVEAVEHHIEHGLSPHDATVKAMEEVCRPRGCHRPDPRGGFHSHCLRSRHHRTTLQTVRRDHCHFGALLGFQCADAQPCTLGYAAAAKERSVGTPWSFFSLVQSRLWQGDGRVCRCVPSSDSQSGTCFPDAWLAGRGGRFLRQEDTRQFPSR